MKKFEFENKTTQFHEMILYAHSPEFENGSIEEMEDFLFVFLKHFQHTKHNDGKVTPFDETNFATQQWRACVTHIREAISVKKSNKQHMWLLGVSISTLVVLILTLAHQIWNSAANEKQQEIKCKVEIPSKPPQA